MPEELKQTLLAAASEARTMTGSYSDPLGSETEVGVYFTPSFTGAKAWEVGKQINTMSVSVEHGQIVATATAEQSSSTVFGSACDVVSVDLAAVSVFCLVILVVWL
jgi:hypothetical protein